MRTFAIVVAAFLLPVVVLAVELPVVPLSAIQESKAETITPPAEVNVTKPERAPISEALKSVPHATRQDMTVTPLKVISGVNEIVEVAVGHLNRIVTPFESPEVYTASQAKTKVVGNVVYVGTDKTASVGLYITHKGEGGAEAISLTLVPKRIPPRELRVQIQSFANGGDGRARRWEESHPYVETLRNLFRTIALGDRPAGYELREKPSKWVPPCDTPAWAQGLTFDFGKGQSAIGHHFEVAIGLVRNGSDRPIELDETWCAGHDIAAIAFWPRNLLEPGQSTEAYVAKRIVPGARAPERRSLLGDGG